MEVGAASSAVAGPARWQRFAGTDIVWRLSLVLVAALIALPVVVIVASLWQPYSAVWQHLLDTVMADYVVNSLLLMAGVGLGTLVLGVSSAWLTAMCEFPGRRFFTWALLLPMAMPAYIIAYTYTGLLDFAGPLQTALRDAFGWRYGEYWFPEIRSLGGGDLHALFGALSLCLSASARGAHRAVHCATGG